MALNNALTQKTAGGAPTQAKTFSQFLGGAGVKASLAASLGSETAVEKFTSSILSAVSVNPALQKCDFATVVSAGLLANALALSLSPSLGYAYLVPFEDRKNNRTVATFILGYRGYLQLAMRSGYYKKIVVWEIKEGELVKYDPLNEEITFNLITDDFNREQTPTVGYYAMFEHLNGFKKVLYWSKEKMLAHADKYSKAFSVKAERGRKSFADFEAGKVPENEMWRYSSYWYSDFDGMAKKTMLRQLLSKWGIMSIDMQTAYDKDSEHTDAFENNAAEMFAVDTEGEFFASTVTETTDTTTQEQTQEAKKGGRKKNTTVDRGTGEVIETPFTEGVFFSNEQ